MLDLLRRLAQMAPRAQHVLLIQATSHEELARDGQRQYAMTYGCRLRYHKLDACRREQAIPLLTVYNADAPEGAGSSKRQIISLSSRRRHKINGVDIKDLGPQSAAATADGSPDRQDRK